MYKRIGCYVCCYVVSRYECLRETSRGPTLSRVKSQTVNVGLGGWGTVETAASLRASRRVRGEAHLTQGLRGPNSCGHVWNDTVQW